METAKILIISLLAAVAVGTIGGMIIGKIMVKRARADRKPLLTKKERIIYLSCVLLGMAFILFGVFYKPPVPDMLQDDMISFEDGAVNGGISSGRKGGGVIMARNGVAVARRG